MFIELFGLTINWPSQICGIISTIFQIIAFFQKDKKKFIFYGIFGYFFSTLEPILIMLGGVNSWAGIFANIISMVRNILILYFLVKKNKEMPWWTGLLSCVILWALSIPFANEWYSYLMPALVTFLTLILLSKNFVVNKIGVIISEIGFVLYGLMITSYTGMMRDGILTVVAIVSLILYLTKHSKTENQSPNNS